MSEDFWSQFKNPTSHPFGRKSINVHGRKEHESYLKDPQKCKDAGLDIMYETMVYLKRWGGWLEDEKD